MIPVLAAAAALSTGPAAAMAATTSTDSISGLEYAATSAQGRFAGIASGALPGAWSEAWGHAAVARLFDGSDRPDAIFCGNDQIARGVIDALRERGLDVPGDVGVVGFDNWEIVAAQSRPPLTSVDMNLAALGREAGLTLLSLVDGKPVQAGIRKLPCRLVVRQSCGRPAGG